MRAVDYLGLMGNTLQGVSSHTGTDADAMPHHGRNLPCSAPEFPVSPDGSLFGRVGIAAESPEYIGLMGLWELATTSEIKQFPVSRE
jgi:hypothetical protein